MLCYYYDSSIVPSLFGDFKREGLKKLNILYAFDGFSSCHVTMCSFKAEIKSMTNQIFIFVKKQKIY